VHLGPPVLDKVERSWSCWRHPNASGVGVNVACAMGNTRFSQAPGDFLEGGCRRVAGLILKLILVFSLSAYPVVMSAEQGGDGKGWVGL
jgi:hypothetical protein